MKYIKQISAIIIALLTIHGNSWSQSQSVKVKQLKIGEEIPNLPLENLYNYKGKEKSLHDFKGKVLILDFWATWCTPCISAFPKMEELKKKFNNEIAILPVTSDDKSKVEPLLINIKKDVGMDLFSVISDQKIKRLFNFQFIPHYVIIGKDGKYLTDATIEEINEQNLALLLKNENGQFATKKTKVTRYDYDKPLFNQYISLTEDLSPVDRKVEMKDIIVRSTLSKKMEGVYGPYMINNGRVLMPNVSIDNILGHLFGIAQEGGERLSKYFYYLPHNRKIWEVKNKDLLGYSSIYINSLIAKNDPDWRSFFDAHKFCYEMMADDSVGKQQMAKMAINDINFKLKQMYNLSSSIEKRRIKCLVLRRTSEQDRIGATSNDSESTSTTLKNNVYDAKIKNQNYRLFLLQLVTLSLSNIVNPIIDETGFPYDKIVDIQLTGKMTDWKSVNNALQKYDLTLEEAERIIDMIIISDSKPVILVQ
jgi:thiol-disulfide isomerase/thioredoxin